MSDSPSTDYTEPLAKRSRVNAEEAVTNSGIPMDVNKGIQLDHLHMYHLRYILDYLSMHDILSSMKVSKQWQANMLEYLQGSRFCFEYYYLPRTHYVPRLLGLVDDVRHRRTLPFEMSPGDLRGFQMKIEELGPAIISIVLDYLDDTSLKIITQNCPNLQDLMLVGLQARPAHKPQGPPVQLPGDQQELNADSAESGPQTKTRPVQGRWHERVTEEGRHWLRELQLKRVSFVHSPNVKEEYIREFLKSGSLEDIIICRNRSVEGSCLSGVESNLKRLRLVACSLKFIYLNTIVDRLSTLTMLDLSNNPAEILLNVHRLLDKTPNLEYLLLNSYEQTNVSNDFVESLRRLGRLKHLSLCWNDNVSDAWLEALALDCQNLETVDIETKISERHGRRRIVTGNGVQALCRGAPKLVHLGVAGHGTIDNTQLAHCVSVCPDLESLDLRGCTALAPLASALVPLAGAARAAAAAAAAAGRAPRPQKPLRLLLAHTTLLRYQLAQAPEGLIYDFVDAPRLLRLV